MASSPQPLNVREGAEAAEVDENPALPANAEDRKAAEAMSSLERRGEDDDDTSKSRNVDTEALGKAMQNLGVTDDGSKGEKKPEEKKIKIDAADVTLLVDQLELPKGKATELLKTYDGDAVKAMTSYVTTTA